MSFSCFSIQSRIPPGAFPETFLVFHDLDSFEKYCQLFCRIFLNLGLFLVIRVKCALLGSITQSYRPFSVHDIRGYIVSICIIGDVNFDHLARVVSARILHCELALSPSLLDFEHAHLLLLWN